MSEIKVPELGESILEATISSWLKNIGDSVAEGEAIAELETDKVNVEVPATSSGVLQSILKQEGETVNVGEAICVIGEAADASPTAPTVAATPAHDVTPSAAAVAQAVPKTEATKPIPQAASDLQPVNAPPSVRRLARQYGIDLQQVQGGLGRVSKGDVLAHVEGKPVGNQLTSALNQAKTEAALPQNEAATRPDEERIRMSRRRQTIAKRLVEVQHTAAMLTTFNEVDMTTILNIRKRWKEKFKDRYDIGLGFMSFFSKAVVGALKAFPLLNAEIDGDDMIVKHHYDIGIAVSTDAGLVVPVVRNVDRLSFAQIEQEISTLAKKARSNSLGIKDLQGGTFTITNGGVFGSLLSTPILNAPQVGILGMHAIQKRPIEVNDQVEIRPMMYIALSYDHRLIDGSEAVQFLVRVKHLLEDAESLLIEG